MSFEKCMQLCNPNTRVKNINRPQMFSYLPSSQSTQDPKSKFYSWPILELCGISGMIQYVIFRFWLVIPHIMLWCPWSIFFQLIVNLLYKYNRIHLHYYEGAFDHFQV